MVNDLGALRKLASAYSKSQTFIFIEEVINNKVHYYNGYIIKVHTDMILFYDSKLKQEFPILLETIKLMTPSRNEGGDDGKRRNNQR